MTNEIDAAQALLRANNLPEAQRKQRGVEVLRGLDASTNPKAVDVKNEVARRLYGVGGRSDYGRMLSHDPPPPPHHFNQKD